MEPVAEPADGPDAAAHLPLCFEHDDVVAALDELVGHDESCEAGADHDHATGTRVLRGTCSSAAQAYRPERAGAKNGAAIEAHRW
jgi:hypothetical protein